MVCRASVEAGRSELNILGISAFYHDSAAALVRDGVIVAAAQEERFTRKKHDAGFPSRAIEYCLREGGMSARDLDVVAYYDKPLLKFERILETYFAYAPRGFRLFRKGLPVWAKQKLFLQRELNRGLGHQYQGRFVYMSHHESHAASAYFPSPFADATVLTLDGVGEWATASIARGRDNRLDVLEEMHFPHSLGLVYSTFTYFTGFKVNSGEYKLMGLAPYGRPRFKQLILDNLFDLREDGSFRLNLDYFAYCHEDVMAAPKLNELLGGPPRAPEAAVTQREMDIAASIQAVTEEIVLRTVRHAFRINPSKNLALAGGVALNCVCNGRILREGPFENLWVQPAAGDAGGALGAAMFVWHQLAGKPRTAVASDAQRGSLLGPAYSNEEVRAFLDAKGAVYHFYPDEQELVAKIAQLLVEQKVVGHVAGRMEFGPRALGNRSILGDPRSLDMQSTMNLKIKFRESFRPFAPAVLQERVHEFFEVREHESSPYMLLVAPVREDKRLGVDDQVGGFDMLKQARSEVPAITHVDYSARLQTVSRDKNPRFHAIIRAFEALTECPIVINTSFNVRGEPIVNSPEDAYRCFLGTNMDVLVLENCVLYRNEQPDVAGFDRRAYVQQFDLD